MVNAGPGGGGSLSSVQVGAFLSDDGTEILVGKLVSTLLGGLWITVIAGWITVVEAIVAVHVRVLNAMTGLSVGVIRAAGVGGAETLRVAWAEAFRAAAAANPLFAPTIMTLELVLVSALLLFALRRWTE